MNTITRLCFCVCLLLLTAGIASADLYDWAVNINGVVSSLPPLGADPLPASVNAAGFDTTTGLGTVIVSFIAAGAGPFYISAFFDHEIDETINTYFNETGAVTVVPPAAGLSWEIDEPGYAFGDIYTNFAAGALDNSIGVATPEDVSMALGWTFAAAAGDSIVARFVLSDVAPALGTFYLAQIDPDSGKSIYLSTNLQIGTSQIPEPESWLLLATIAAITMAAYRRRLA